MKNRLFALYRLPHQQAVPHHDLQNAAGGAAPDMKCCLQILLVDVPVPVGIQIPEKQLLHHGAGVRRPPFCIVQLLMDEIVDAFDLHADRTLDQLQYSDPLSC